MGSRDQDNLAQQTMSRRRFLGRGLAAGAALAGGRALGELAAAAPASTSAKPPNLLFIFADQQSYDMLGCYRKDLPAPYGGAGHVDTPNLDRFAAEGVRFTQCVSNSPVCTPYRGMLMTGQHPLYNGCFTNDIQLLTDGHNHFGEVLRDAGYRTGYVGKWHLYGGDRNRPIPAGPHRHGFDDLFLSNNCTVQFYPPNCYYFDQDTGLKKFYSQWEMYGQADQAMSFLDGCSADQPWSLFLSWHSPHDSLRGTQEDGVTPTSLYDTLPELMARYDPQKIVFRPSHTTPHPTRTREDYHGHLAQCSGLDLAFGQILDKLQQKGFAENTIIVYTADHGDHLPASPMGQAPYNQYPGANGRPRTKNCPEQPSVHVPLLIRWPQHLAPRVSNLLVGAMDLMPTLLGLAGLNVPTTCQGRNLAQAIQTANDDAVESVPLFHHDAMGWRGVYTRRYTYSIQFTTFFPDFPASQLQTQDRNWPVNLNTDRLYDRQEDLWEMQNLFGSAAHRALKDDLHALMREWMRKFRDPFPYARILASDPENIFFKNKTQQVLNGRPIDHLEAAGCKQLSWNYL